MFERVAFVWGENQSHYPLPSPPGVGVAMWPHVLGCPTLRWSPGEMPDISAYDLFLVNLFHTADSTHIAQIRSAKPEAVIVAMPDAPVDMVVNTPEWIEMLRQMALADWIGGRTHYDREVYGTFLNKPTLELPSPVGPCEWYAQFRALPKENFIITQDHGFSSPASAQNVAALAGIQRETGYKVVYARPFEHTKEYARLAGLEAEWHENIPFSDFVERTARAKLCVDLYARHSYHRHAVVSAMVGTPCIASEWSTDLVSIKRDPYCVSAHVEWAIDLLKQPRMYRLMQKRGYRYVNRYSFGQSRARMQKFVERVL